MLIKYKNKKTTIVIATIFGLLLWSYVNIKENKNIKANNTTVRANLLLNNTEEQNKEAINIAIEKAGLDGNVKLPCGIFDLGLYMFETGNITLIGCGKPSLSSNEEELIGGTVLRGQIDLNIKDNITLQGLGVDVKNTQNIEANGDAIRSGGQRKNVPQGTTLIGITTLLEKGLNHGHGAVFTSGDNNRVFSTTHYGGAHGLVFRSSDNVAWNNIAENGTASLLTIKGFDSSGDAVNNKVNGFYGKNGHIVIEAHGNTITENNNVTAIIQNPTDEDNTIDGIEYREFKTKISGYIKGTLGINNINIQVR